MDALDTMIYKALKSKPRARVFELSRAVGISEGRMRHRLKKLLSEGGPVDIDVYIKPTQPLYIVGVRGGAGADARQPKKNDAVVAAYETTGTYAAILHVRTGDIAAVLKDLDVVGVADVLVVLNELKSIS